MALIRPFRGLRPHPEFAAKVAAPPYDVINTEEARQLAEGNAYSFLHVTKPEIDLQPDINLYDQKVYKQGADNLKRFIEDHILFQDDKPSFYLYQQTMGEHKQIGLVACASTEEYRKNKIKKHELTRVEKEEDRLKHIMQLKAQTGPVFLTYRARKSIDSLIGKIIKQEPVYDFKTDDQIQHTFWVVSHSESIDNLTKEFAQVDFLYVADGHHRSAAATRTAEELQNRNPDASGEEEYNFFLAVLFPDNQMKILGYNRVLKDLNGLSESEFLDALRLKFLVREFARSEGYTPKVSHDFGMYLNGMWYRLSAIPGTWDDNHPTGRLDVSILYENLLKPILGINDPRTDKRIDFVGGIRGIEGLEARVDTGEMTVAFSLFPVIIDDLLATADAGETMPPKSTWFEPKLRSGLITHMLD